MLRRTEGESYLRSMADTHDPFTFLVVEQIIKEQARKRIPEIKPSGLFRTKQRADYQRAIDSYAEIEHMCNALWADLCFRLMKTQVETTTLPYEAELRRRQRLIKHQEDLEEVDFQRELRRRRLGDSMEEREERLAEVVDEQRFLDVQSEAQLDRQQRSRLADLANQRELFETINAVSIQLHHENAMRFRELELQYQVLLSELTPDKADPAYLAERRSVAYNVYADMVRKVMNDTTLTPAEQRRDVKLIFEMATR